MARLSLIASLSVFMAATCVQGLGTQHADTLAGSHHHKDVSRQVDQGNLTRRGYQSRTNADTNKRATNYGAGESACGPSYSPDEYVVALAQNTFGFSYPSAYCNRPIVISYGGRTANAKIVDSCVRCAQFDPHAIDLSTGLFEHFASLDLGVIAVDWSFTDGSGGGDDGGDEKKTTTTKAHTTSTHHTTPTSTSTRHSTTSARSNTSTSTHSSTKTKASTSTSRATSTSTSSATSATSSSTSLPPAGGSGNLQGMLEVILSLEDMLEASRST